MKIVTISLLAGLATALPQSYGSEGLDVPKVKPGSNMISTIASLTDRNGLLDAGVEPHVRNEIIDRAPCGKVTFIFARASSEVPNMGGSMGPIICNGLKKKYGDKSVLCQGVGNGYTASITDNIGGVGTSRAAIAEATKMFTMAASQCPDAIITFGGYSQGTAVMHATVGKLPANIKDKLVGGVLFGDTRNKQDGSAIPNFPKDKVVVYCTKDDGVCGGLLNVTNGHFVYTINGDGDKAMVFLRSKIDAALKSG